MINTQRLLQLRKERGITQAEIANEIGVERTTYVRYEKGDIQMSIEMLKKISSFFNITSDYLLWDSSIPNIDPDVFGLVQDVNELIPSNKELLKGIITMMIESQKRGIEMQQTA